jgi:predicted MFS family arabinose efflux permease
MMLFKVVTYLKCLVSLFTFKRCTMFSHQHKILLLCHLFWLGFALWLIFAAMTLQVTSSPDDAEGTLCGFPRCKF